MSKNKQKKDADKKFIYNNEVTGIILILISIIGICRYGPVGRFISSFAVFLVYFHFKNTRMFLKDTNFRNSKAQG